MVIGVVLAAGDSSRMGSPKSLLADPDGVPFVVRIARTMRSGGLEQQLIITGRHHDDIAAVLETWPVPGVRIVRNPDPSRGQLSSLMTALDACETATEAIAVTLVDVPMVTAATVRAVHEAWVSSGAPIVRPEYRGRRGHPVIFDRSLFTELRQAPLAAGARAVVSAHYTAIVNVPVDDQGAVTDVDTPEEYRALIREGSRSG